MAVLALAACSDGSVEVDMAVQATAGNLPHVAPTLAAAKRNFFGDSGPDGGSDGGSGAGGTGGGGGVFDDVGGVEVQGAPASVASVMLTRTDAVAGVALRSRFAAEQSHLHGRLPHGLGVLTDPLQVTLWAYALRAEVTAGHSLPLPGGGRLDTAAGLGWTEYAARSHIRSALLDLRSDSSGGLPYVVLDSRLAPARGPELAGELRLYGEGKAELRLGVAQRF